MSIREPPTDSRSAAERWRQVHAACSQFEDAWNTPQACTIESLIADARGEYRAKLLTWLIRSELELRGTPSTAELQAEYLRRFPADCEAVIAGLADEDPTERVLRDVAAAGRTISPSDTPRSGNRRPLADPVNPSRSAPRKLGDYELLNEIARGGMGVVYRAWHPKLNRTVALKVLLGGRFLSPAALARFRKETQLIAALDHPGIVPIFEVGESSDHYFYSMPLIEGSNLADWIGQQAPTPTEAVDVIRLVSLAVDYAHSQDVIHRDIKPRNILVDREGRPRVTDFGLAKLLTPASSDAHPIDPTVTGQILGTPEYMAPEQAAGKGRDADRRSDVYSLGAVLYTALTRRPPFQTDNVIETLRQVQQEEPIPPCRLNPAIPRDLETIVLKAMSKDPELRYRTAGSLAEDLRCFRVGLPILARRMHGITKAWLWCRRNPRLATMTAIASAFLLIAAVGWGASHVLRFERDRAIDAEAHARRAEEAAQKAEQVAQARQYLARATSLRISGIPGSRAKALRAIRSAVTHDRGRALTHELRDEAIAILAMTDVDSEVLRWSELIPTHGVDQRTTDVAKAFRDFALRQSEMGRALTHAFTADYRRCALWHADARRLLVVDLAQRQVVFIADDVFAADERAAEPAMFFDRSGRTLLVSNNMVAGKLVAFDVATGNRLFTTTRQFGLALCPQGRYLAIGRADPCLELVDLGDPASTRRAIAPSAYGSRRDREGDASPIRCVDTPHTPVSIAFSPTGDRIAVAYDARVPLVTIHQAESLKQIGELPLPNSGAVHLAWCPNERDLCSALGGTGSAEVWDLEAQRMIQRTPGGNAYLFASSVDPLGAYFATSYWNGITRIWCLHSGQLELTVEPQILLAWDPTGRVIGHRQSPKGLEILRWSRGEIVRSLPEMSRLDEDAFPSQGMFSPDGRMAAVRLGTGGSHFDGHVAFWDARLGRFLGGFPVEKCTAMTFSKDGRGLSLLDRNGLTWLPMAGGEGPRLQIGPAATRELSAASAAPASIAAESPHVAYIRDGYVHIALVSSSDLVDHDVPAERHALLGGTTVETKVKLLPGQGDVTISSDGRWVACGGWHATEVLLIDRMHPNDWRRLSLGPQTGILFSPDSQQLVTCRWDAYRFWDLESLGNVLTLPRSECQQPDAIAIRSDGKLAVTRLRPGGLDLVSLPSGTVLCRLQRPRPTRAAFLALSPDASHVLEGCGHADSQVGSQGLVLWDLRRLHRELAELGLDIAELAPPEDAVEPVSIQSVTFEGMERFADYSHIGGLTESSAQRRILELEQAWKADPTSALAANDLAWALLMAPPSLRDPPRALELSEKAMALGPESSIRNTLAAACFRLGELDRAIELLRVNVLQAPEADLPYDYLFLALCHIQKGNELDARNYLRMARSLMGAERNGGALVRRSSRQELRAIAAEVEASLNEHHAREKP